MLEARKVHIQGLTAVGRLTKKEKRLNNKFSQSSSPSNYQYASRSYRCSVCGQPAGIPISTGEKTFMLCDKCNEIFFMDLTSSEDKMQRLTDAREICRQESISVGFALNIIKGRYSLQEAKRRYGLKKREESGKSVDFYSVGKRMPGGYRG